MNAEHILVTGGAGFIGSHTVDLLLRQNKQVIVLDNLLSGKRSRLDSKNPNLEFVEGDVLEFPLLKELVEKVDAVLHLAAIASVQESITDPIYSFQINLQGSLHVLEAARELERNIGIVLASSAAVYGEKSKLPCQDNVPLIEAVLSPYALQKVQMEQYADLYHRLFGLNVISMRYFNVYGPGQDGLSSYSGVISRFLDAYQMHEPCKIFGDGKQTRDFIHVSDIAHANALALQKTDYHGPINIATGVPHTVLEIIKIIEESSSTKLNIEYQPEKVGDLKHSYAAIEKAEEILGFKAQTNLSQGIRHLVQNTFVD